MYLLKPATEKDGSLIIPYAVKIVIAPNTSRSKIVVVVPPIQLPVYDSSWKEFTDASESQENTAFLFHLIDLVQFANAGIKSITDAITNDI